MIEIRRVLTEKYRKEDCTAVFSETLEYRFGKDIQVVKEDGWIHTQVDWSEWIEVPTFHKYITEQNT